MILIMLGSMVVVFLLSMPYMFSSNNVPVKRSQSQICDLYSKRVRSSFNVCSSYFRENYFQFDSKSGHLFNDIAIRKKFLPVIKNIFPHIKNNYVILDVGAGKGEDTSLFKTFYPSNNIYSFDACKSNYEIMKNRLSEYGSIKVFNYGVGNLNTTKYYKSEIITPKNEGKEKSENEIQFITIDQFLNQSSILIFSLLFK